MAQAKAIAVPAEAGVCAPITAGERWVRRWPRANPPECTIFDFNSEYDLVTIRRQGGGLHRHSATFFRRNWSKVTAERQPNRGNAPLTKTGHHAQ